MDQPVLQSPAGARSDDFFEYVVIGSGAGGGPVAARLARAGRKVLLLEAGGDGNNSESQFRYAAVGQTGRLDPELGWAYWVNSRAHDDDRRKQNFFVPEKGGLYYPRGTSIGGSTCINAMISLYPDNSDWDAIAALTGDASWGSDGMRNYFQRLERASYVDARTAEAERRGRDGWLSMELIGAKKNLFRDPKLTEYIISRVAGVEGADALAFAAQNGEEFIRDPNNWSAVTTRVTGMVAPPRAAYQGARRGSREFLLQTAAEFPENLVIRTNCLATRLLFDDQRSNCVIGVAYREGKHLYEASQNVLEVLGPDAPRPDQPGVEKVARVSREIVISAGAFNSPQLLMLSGIGPREQLEAKGIAVRVELPGVGRNLQDRLETGVVCPLDFKPNLYENCKKDMPDDPCRAVFENGDPKGEYRTRVNRQMYMVRRSEPTRVVPNLVTFGFTGEFRGYFMKGKNYPNRGNQSPAESFTWFTLSGHTHNTGGTIGLKSNDPLVTPEINFNNFEDGTDTEGRDLEALLQGVKAARKMAALGADGPVRNEYSPGGNVVTDDELRAFIKNEAWGHHASCSNRMGPASDPMAVVDSRFRVHGIAGLRVVDASVFPRIPGLFIAVPIYMAAEKASDAILEDAAISG